ncbi:hypothetical protein DL770_006620 [Monosporascus sp. CRB-9-2]|nr:hypothetical protein DL770_006620 [Monosporascus sp. CRB-9-2]
MIVPYIEDFHGDGLDPHSVATVTKHFPGGGPVENGEDSHFSYGKAATYPGNNLGYHLVPFKATIAAGARAVPYYSRPIGTKNRASKVPSSAIGVLITNQNFGQPMPAKACGAEHLSEPERMPKILNPGVDQFGGEHVTDMLVDLIWNGPVSEGHIGTISNETYAGARNATVVDTPEEVEFALLKMEAPSFPRSGAFEKSFASGSFEVDEEGKARQAKIYAAGAFLDVVFGLAKPEGRLPFDLRRSMAAVGSQFEDVPLRYRGPCLLVRRRSEVSRDLLANPTTDALGRGTPKLRTATGLSFYLSRSAGFT